MDNNIAKLITLSSGHISYETSLWLDYNHEITVFLKGEYGWFIFINYDGSEEYLKALPDDLREVVKYAMRHECLWVCLDRDGSAVNELPTYDW